MPVVNVITDLDNLTLTIEAEFAAPVQRIWEVYADPRQLERVWGPPQYPATFAAHSMTPGGRMNYFMTSPEGEKYYGFWDVIEVDEPRAFSFTDGFANDDFTANTDLPTSVNDYRFEATDGGTKATFVSTFQTLEGLQQVLDMGVIEGASAAIAQIDGLVGR